MSLIIELLQEAKEKGQTISVITIEGPASYKNIGKVIEIEEQDILLQKPNGKKLAIKISNIIKVED